MANGFQLTGALGSNFSSVIVRCILATSTLEGGKTAAKSVMAAVAAHREEFEFDRHCSGPNLDATPNDIIRRIERDSAVVDLVALMGNYAATAAFGSICSLLSIRSSMRTRNYLCRPTQFRRTDNPERKASLTKSPRSISFDCPIHASLRNINCRVALEVSLACSVCPACRV